MTVPVFTRTPDLARLADYPAHWAATRPQACAVIDGNRVISHARFDALVQQVAAALLATGVRRGDCVAMLATPCTEHLAHFMAAARIGAVWLGLNTRARTDELAHVLADAQPRVVVAMLDIEGRSFRPELDLLRPGPLAQARLVSLQGAEAGCQGWSEFLAEGAGAVAQVAAAAAQVQPQDPALIVYTSGSTGKPKGALLSHRSIVTTARIQCEHWWAQPFRILNNAPINHIGGAVQVACHAIVAGGTQVLMPRFDPEAMPALIRERRVTVIHQVPTMYQLLLEKGRPGPADLATLQALIWSGAAAPRSLVQALRGHCRHLFTSFGMTETGGEVLYTAPDASDEALASSVGFPVPSIPLRLGLLDGSGPAPDGQGGCTGEIQVQGPTVMSGYLRRPDATAQAFTADGWLRTGDIGERLADGSCRITGRLREMYKSGGFNVYPREVELVLENHPGVAMAAVVGVPDPVYGEVGHAWVLAAEAVPDAAELCAWCRQRLANYKVPKQIHVRRELPMLPIHKLDKVVLQRWSRGATDEPSGSAPTTA